MSDAQATCPLCGKPCAVIPTTIGNVAACECVPADRLYAVDPRLGQVSLNRHAPAKVYAVSGVDVDEWNIVSVWSTRGAAEIEARRLEGEPRGHLFDYSVVEYEVRTGAPFATWVGPAYCGHCDEWGCRKPGGHAP